MKIICVIIHKILSQNTLLNKFNVCSILTKHYFTVARTFAVGGTTANSV